MYVGQAWSTCTYRSTHRLKFFFQKENVPPNPRTCEPLVLGPEFAIETTPAPVCLRSRLISSSNLPPKHDSPPRPVPVGSPPWTMKSLITRWKMVLS